MESGPEGEAEVKYPATYEAGERAESTAAKLIALNIANKDKVRSPATLLVLQKIRRLVPLGTYEHFKSTPEDRKLYTVTGIDEDVNTGLCYVKYVAQYGAYKGEEGLRVLAGPDSFLRPIDRPEYRGVRFRSVPDEDVELIDD